MGGGGGEGSLGKEVLPRSVNFFFNGRQEMGFRHFFVSWSRRIRFA